MTSINKQASLLDFALVKSVDILFITETWLNNHVDNRILSLFGQNEVISRCDRINGPHGGVAVLAKQNIFSQVHVLSLPLSYDFVSSIVWLQPRNLAKLFILVYLPPFSSPYTIDSTTLSACLDNVETLSSQVIPSNYQTSVFLLGDLNMPSTI